MMLKINKLPSNETFKFFYIVVVCFVFIECRNPNQIAKVKYEMQGCFGSEKSELLIYKRGNSTFSKLTTNGKHSLEAKLNNAQLDSFNLFIKELKVINGGFCTTEEIFTAYVNNETINKTIMECQWNGFFNLKRYLFH